MTETETRYFRITGVHNGKIFRQPRVVSVTIPVTGGWHPMVAYAETELAKHGYSDVIILAHSKRRETL